MSTRRPSGHDKYDSVGDQDREEPSTLILETSAVADRRKTKETVDGGEQSEADADDGVEMGIQCGKTNKRVGRNYRKEGRGGQRGDRDYDE